MKRNESKTQPLLIETLQAIAHIKQWRKQPVALAIAIALCLNLVTSPVVYALSGNTLEPRYAWAIGILGAVTVALVIYLFIVVFQPERF